MPACTTMYVCNATVMLPVRDVLQTFGSTVNVAEPFPLPLLVVCNHCTFATASHAHSHGAVTPHPPLPPAATRFVPVALNVYVHRTPACTTVNVSEATEIVP